MTYAMKTQLAQMARHHAWATRRLLGSASTIPDKLYRKPCGLFFGSIHGTLNHLLLTDSEIWYKRFLQSSATSLSLDAELESDRALLAARLISATARWEGYVESLDENTLASELQFTMTTGQRRNLPMDTALLHVFNHATHHRGQITAAISMLGFEYKPLGLPYMLYAENK